MDQLMYKLLRLPINLLKKPRTVRNFSVTKCLLENYEGDGKTTVTILNREYKHLIMFDALSDQGFRLNNGIFILGPVAAFPRTVLQWNVSSMENLSPECFSLFSVLEPKLDLLILGTGNVRKQLNSEVLSFLKANKINTEVLPTEQACSTFNFLNVEGRCVAGAFLPPEEMQLYEDELKLISTSDDVNPFPEVFNKG